MNTSTTKCLAENHHSASQKSCCTCDTLAIVVVVVVVVRLGGGERRGACDHCFNFLSEGKRIIIIVTFLINFVIKTSTKKNHNTTTPAYPHMYAEPHQVSCSAPLLLYPIMTKKWAKNVRSEIFLTISRRKKKQN